MLANVFGVELWKGCIKVQEKKRKLLSCVPVLDKTWIQSLSRCSPGQRRQRNVQKKRDARANYEAVVLLIKPIAFLPFSLPSASSLLKLPSYWCATLRRSRNKRSVGSCWLKSLTGFKLCATTRNKIQQHATGCANGRNMFDMPTFKSDWNIKFLLWKQRGRWVETKLSQSIPFHSCTFILMGSVWLYDEFTTRT